MLIMDIDERIALSKLSDPLPACTAGGDGLIRETGDQDCTDQPAATCYHAPYRLLFGTGAGGIGGIFDIAASVHSPCLI